MTERHTLILLFVTALMVRSLLHYFFAAELIVGSDQIDYINLGRHLGAGELSGLLDTYWPPFFPFLIGLAGLFVDGLMAPAIVVAIVAGSLIPPLTYILVHQSYGERPAVVAGALAVFYPYFLNSVFAVGSENVYVLLITACLITGWKAITTESLINYAVTGALVGLAYLTRPEAFAYPAFFIAIILAKNIVNKDKIVERTVKYAGVFVIAFLVFALPYLMFLKSATGKWTISGKTEINTVMGSYHEVVAPDDEGVVEPSVSVVTGVALLKLMALNAIEINKSLAYLIPLGVAIFVSLGLFSGSWGHERFKREIYLMSFCGLTLLGYAAAVVQTRYLYILIPITLGWTANGIIEFGAWLYRTSERWNWPSLASLAGSGLVRAVCIVVLLVYLLPVNFFMRSSEASSAERPYEERAAGLWLKENAPPDAKIFSARKIPTFYAEAVQVSPKSTDGEKVFQEIRSGDVDYVITSDRQLSRNPYLRDLEKQLLGLTEFERVYDNADNPDYKISIFRRRR